MTFDQGMLFALIGLILVFLVWGRFRHDLVAAGGLFLAVIFGLIPDERAFEGFSNPAVIVVALVLVASRAIENSGALSVLAKPLSRTGSSVPLHITIIGGIGAGLSSLINNVAALAILMPLDVQSSRRNDRPPARTLMPLAFATILGGMVTLIGTPTNLVASSIRDEQLGAPYSMFDFTPVGLTVALVGLVFVALVGWRMVPSRADNTARLEGTSFDAELVVPEDSAMVGEVLGSFQDAAKKADVQIIRLIRDGQISTGWQLNGRQVAAGDRLVVRGATDGLAEFIKAAGLQPEEGDPDHPPLDENEEKGKASREAPVMSEVVVRSDSALVGRSAEGVGLRSWYGLTLLGISRSGTLTRDHLPNMEIHPGDVLLLSGPDHHLADSLAALGLMPVATVSVAPSDQRRAVLAAGIFAVAVGIAAAGLLSFTVSIAIAVALYGAFGLVPARDFYKAIDWSIVVMLACLLPIGKAFESVGGTALVAGAMADLTAEAGPVVALVAIMVVTMTLSDMLNNIATIVITGPVSIELARRLDANPDTFLMGVAVAASCAFLTPIGHKNNTLIMGPGGLRFGDYWPMGLPLELVVLGVSVPALLIFWPL